jgi:hypothetical protein
MLIRLKASANTGLRDIAGAEPMIPSVTTTEKAMMASRRSRTKISPRSFQTVRRMTLMGTEVSPPTVWAWFEPHELVAAGYEVAGPVRNAHRLRCLPIPYR